MAPQEVMKKNKQTEKAATPPFWAIFSFFETRPTRPIRFKETSYYLPNSCTLRSDFLHDVLATGALSMTSSRAADKVLPPTLRSYGAFNKAKLVERACLLFFFLPSFNVNDQQLKWIFLEGCSSIFTI